MEPLKPAPTMTAALRSAADAARAQLHLSEQELLAMPELSFEVTKTLNKWPHKKVSRILRLSADCVSNIRSADGNQPPSSSYTYDRIIKVVMTDLRTFVIEYKGAGHKYLYQSAVALQIVQEIEARQRLLEASRKWRETLKLHQQFIYKFNDPSPQTRTAALDIAGVEAPSDAADFAITEPSTSPHTNALARERSLSSLLLEGTRAPHSTPETPPWQKINPAQERLSRPSTIRYSGEILAQFASGSMSTVALLEGSDAESDSSFRAPFPRSEGTTIERPRSIPKRVRLSTITTHRAKKLSGILGQDDFARIDASVVMVLKNQTYEEARVLRHFMDNFGVLEKNPVTLQMNVRNFMDQLKYRLLTPESRSKFQFDRIVLQSKSKEQLESFVEASIERIVIGPVFERIMCVVAKIQATTANSFPGLPPSKQMDKQMPSLPEQWMCTKSKHKNSYMSRSNTSQEQSFSLPCWSSANSLGPSSLSISLRSS